MIFSPYSQTTKLQIKEILLNLGVTSIKERTVTELDSVGEGEIIIFDGNIINEILLLPKQQRCVLLNEIRTFFAERNLPVLYISIGENYFLLKRIVGYLPITNVSVGPDNTPTIYGLKIYPINALENFNDTNFMYQCSELYEFSDELIYSLIASIDWALRKMSNNPYSTASISHINTPVNATEISKNSAYWQFMSDVEINENYYPYGKFNVIREVYKLVNDGSNEYDWRIFTIKSQTRPGYDIWSNGWRNNRIWTYCDAGSSSTCNLTDYGPGTTSGEKTVTVSIGVQAGEEGAQVTAGFTYSYSVSDVQVLDHSDFSTEEASWEHLIDSTKNVGKTTYYCKPGLQVKLFDGGVLVSTGYDKVRYALYANFMWFYWTSPEINWVYQEGLNPPWSGS